MNWQRLAQNRLLDLAALLLAVISVVRIATMLPAQATRNDFAHYYLAGKLWIEGPDVYGTDLAPLYAEHGFVFEPDVPRASNPPPLVALFAPLALLPARVAFWVWVGVQVLSLMAMLWLVRDLVSRRGFLFVVALSVSAAAVYWHFFYSQVQLPLAALILAAYRWRQRALVGCGLVCVAGLLKLFPLVLLPWFWRRRRDVVGSLVFLGAGVVLTGVPHWAGFAEQGLGVVRQCAVNSTFTFSVPALVSNLGFARYGFAPPVAVAQFWWWAGIVAGLLGLALVYAWKTDPATKFGLLLTAMVAGSAAARGHYLVFLLFPMGLVAARAGPREACGLAATILAVNMQGTQAGPWLDRVLYVKVLANQIPLLGMLMLVGLLVRTGRTARLDAAGKRREGAGDAL